MIGAKRALLLRPRGRALESARPCPSRGRVPASQPGSEDLPEGQERRRARRYARPCPPTHAFLSSKSPCAYATLKKVFALALRRHSRARRFRRHRRHRRRRFRRHRCRRAASRHRTAAAVTRPSAAFVCAVAGPRLRPKGAYCARFGRSLFGRHAGCPWVAGGPAGSAFSRSETLLRAVIGVLPCWGCLKPSKYVPCARVGLNRADFCIVSLTVIIDGP